MHARVADGGAEPRLPRLPSTATPTLRHDDDARSPLPGAGAARRGCTRGDIYRCAGKHGIPVYQNFPCTFDSLGAASTDAAPAAKPAAQPMPAPVRDAPPAAISERAIQPTRAGASEPQPGATDEAVRKAWGEPDEIIQDEPPSGRVEIWRYKDGRSVQINRRHRVIAVQR